MTPAWLRDDTRPVITDGGLSRGHTFKYIEGMPDLLRRMSCSRFFVGPPAVAVNLLPRFVPAMGIAPATMQQRMTEGRIIVALILTAAAGVVSALQIVPTRRNALRHGAESADVRFTAPLGGAFNMLWRAVVVLTIARPGAY